MNCLPLIISHACNHAELWDHVSCTQQLLQVTQAFKKLEKSKLFENLNDAYVYKLEIKLRWNDLLCSREIVNRHFEN